MNLRTRMCYSLSRRLMYPPAERVADQKAYGDWRNSSLSQSWEKHFSAVSVKQKDVLDFGCGDGALSLFLAQNKHPRSVTGVDLNTAAIERARKHLANTDIPDDVNVDFLPGSTDSLPVADETFDILVAFDCMEHVMEPGPILQDWHRVLRPGGRCLVEWFPFKGPWGPHMEALIPIPWAHVFFGQRAMFRAAELIYDDSEFVPRHWDLDENGVKKPNKWRAWSTFKEQGYVNELDIPDFRTLAHEAGFKIERLELHSFGGSPLRKGVSRTLMSIPLIGEYFVSFAAIELVRE